MNKQNIFFFLVIFFLSSYFIDLWITNSNTTSRALPVVTFVESGRLNIDRYQNLTNDKSFVNNHFYSDKAPLPTFLTIPFFAAMKATGIVMPDELDDSLYGKEVYVLGALLCGSLPFAIILLLTYKKIRNKGLKYPVLLASLPFFGSFIFVFAGTYFAHLLSSLFFLAGFIFLQDKKWMLAGLFAGLSFLCEYTIALVFPIWIIQLFLFSDEKKNALRFLLGLLPSVIFIMIYNYVITGSATSMLYKFHQFEELHDNYGFSFPSFESLGGLSFSSYRGLFFYAPAIIALFMFIPRFREQQFLRSYSGPVSILFFLVIAGYFGWHGGWTYGPRLLMPIAVLLIYEVVTRIEAKPWQEMTVLFLSVTGFFLAFLAKNTDVYSLPTEEQQPVRNILIPHFAEGEFNGNNMLTQLFDVSPQVGGWVFLPLIGVALISMELLFRKKVS
jgi:hypothetical protein